MVKKAKVGFQLKVKIKSKEYDEFIKVWMEQWKSERTEERKVNETGKEICMQLTEGTFIGVADGYII